MQTLTRDFKVKKKRNIVKTRDAAKTLTLWLSVLSWPLPMKLTRTNAKLFIIIIAKKNIMPKIVLNLKRTLP